MRRKIFVAVALICFYAKPAAAQTTEPIEADRPDQSESPTPTPKRYFQAEFGFSAEGTNKKNNTLSYPGALFKYGLSKKIDLRLITSLVSDKAEDKKSRGFQPSAIGLRVNLTEEKGIIPKTSILADISLPFLASKNFRSSYYAPAFRFAMLNDLSKKVALSYNLGIEWEESITEPVYIYTLSAGVTITNTTSTYLEVYGFLPGRMHPDHRVDGGFNFLLSNDLVADISAGKSISNPYYFFAAGFSFRVNTGKGQVHKKD